LTAGADTPGAPDPFAAADPRIRLLAATVAVIAEHGFLAADPALIAAEAGLSPPSFHRYFDDLDAAALAAYDGAHAWLDAGLRSHAPPADLAWPLRVRTVVAETLSLLAPHPDLTYFCACEFPRSGAIALARHRAVLSGLAAALRAGRAESARGAELPAHTERVAIGGAISMLGHRARRGEGSQLPSVASEVSYFLLVPYLGVPEAKRIAFGAEALAAAPSPAR
jgi:AcrR family transcriptional regulator